MGYIFVLLAVVPYVDGYIECDLSVTVYRLQTSRSKLNSTGVHSVCIMLAWVFNVHVCTSMCALPDIMWLVPAHVSTCGS